MGPANPPPGTRVSAVCCATSAGPGHHQVDLPGFEAVPGIEMAADLFDQVSLVVVDLTANLAHEMEVIVRMAKFPPGPFIRAQTRLANQIQVGEQGKSAIDRGGVDGRVRLVHLSNDLLDGQVTSGAVQYLPDTKAGLREAVAPVAEQSGQFSFKGHIGILLVANDSQQGL